MNAFGRSLKNVYSLLSRGEEARAYEVLKTIKTSTNEELLELASACSNLELAYELGRDKLLLVSKSDDNIFSSSLYKSLDFLYKVLENQNFRIDSKIMNLAYDKNNYVRLNIGRGLFLSANYKRAIKVLDRITANSLPEFFENQRISILASSYANSKNFLQAAQYYQQLIDKKEKTDYVEEKLLVAECFLQALEPASAIQYLDIMPNEIEQERRLYYLRGVSFHHLNRYQEALTELKKSLYLYQDTSPYELLLAIARLYIDIQEFDKSNEYYERTLAIIPEQHQEHIMHEYARFLKEQDKFREAAVLLKELANNMRYKHKIVAELDLAEMAFELSDVEQAKMIVQRPYNQGLPAAAILLARIAMDKYDYDEAIVYLEQVLAASEKASFEWLSAQVLLAEVFAKKRNANPDRLIMHAKNALTYLAADDDWTMTLESYLEEARAEAIENRVVN